MDHTNRLVITHLNGEPVVSHKTKLYWLAFKVGDDYRLCPYQAESRQDALRHGMEHVLDRELVAVFSDESTLTVEQMLDLATVLPRPGSSIWRNDG